MNRDLTLNLTTVELTLHYKTSSHRSFVVVNECVSDMLIVPSICSLPLFITSVEIF